MPCNNLRSIIIQLNEYEYDEILSVISTVKKSDLAVICTLKVRISNTVALIHCMHVAPGFPSRLLYHLSEKLKFDNKSLRRFGVNM